MSFEIDIWQELALAPTQDKKTVKRAYAKKLKITSPEKDPEGFKKLRWAYEQILNELNSSTNIAPEAPAIVEPLQNNEQSLEVNKPAEKEPVNLIDEIIRSLSYSLEEQAIAYFEEMNSHDELASIMVRQAFEHAVFSYLYQVESNDKWPANFVTLFVNTLGLAQLAEQDRKLAQHLDYFYFRMVCKDNNWTETQYRAHQDLLNKVNDVLISIRVTLFDDGEAAAISTLDKYMTQGVFNDHQFVVEFRTRFLNELNQYFPSTYPYELAQRLETCLHIQDVEKDDYFKDAINNLKERKAASLEVKKFRDFAAKHPHSAKGICYRVILGQRTLSNNITAKARFIYKELLNFQKHLPSFSEKAKHFELVNDKALDDINDWMQAIKSTNGQNFKKAPEDFKPLTTILKQWGIVLAILSFVVVSYLGLDYLQFIPDFKSKDKLMGIGYLNLLGVVSWALGALYYLYGRFIEHNIYGLRHQILLNPELRKKVITGLFVSSILLSALLDYWHLISVYAVMLLIVGYVFLSIQLSVVLLVLPFFPAMGAAKLIGVYVEGTPNVLLHTIMAWLLYAGYLGINHWKYKLNPGTSPHLLATWTVLATLFSLVTVYAYQ